MPVHAHLPRAVAAAGVVAHEPAVVVRGRGLADGVVELGDDGEGREEAFAGFLRADDAFWSDGVDGGSEAFEDEGMGAEAAAECESRGVFEAFRVRDLAF